MTDKELVETVAEYFHVTELAVFERAYLIQFSEHDDEVDGEILKLAFDKFKQDGEIPYWVFGYCTNLIPKNDKKPEGWWGAILSQFGGRDEN